MSQFDIFTIDVKIKQNNERLQRLKQTITKIKANDEQIQVRSLEQVNKVAMFNVLLTRTSEYTIRLGNEYYAKVKTKTALEILQTRIQYLVEQNSKWEKLKNNLTTQAEKKKKMYESMEGKDGYNTMIEEIGENQEGDKIFNIVEFGEGPDFAAMKDKASINKLTTIKQQEETEHQTQIKQKQDIKPEPKQDKQDGVKVKKIDVVEQKQQSLIQIEKQKHIGVQPQQPKKISKFKAERMQAKK